MGSYRAQPYLLWKVPLQALGLWQGRVRVPLAVAICSVAQLEALCGQGELGTEVSFTSPSGLKPLRRQQGPVWLSESP